MPPPKSSAPPRDPAGLRDVSLIAAGLVYAVSRAGYWLEAPAQPPVHADAIVVLGGNDGDRALARSRSTVMATRRRSC